MGSICLFNSIFLHFWHQEQKITQVCAAESCNAHSFGDRCYNFDSIAGRRGIEPNLSKVEASLRERKAGTITIATLIGSGYTQLMDIESLTASLDSLLFNTFHWHLCHTAVKFCFHTRYKTHQFTHISTVLQFLKCTINSVNTFIQSDLHHRAEKIKARI